MIEQYLGQFIIEAGRVVFTTADGQRWRMRQPTPDEAADGDSAYRLTFQRVMEDKRLADLAGGSEAHKREAMVRASAAEAVYLIPLLLEAAPLAPQRGEAPTPSPSTLTGTRPRGGGGQALTPSPSTPALTPSPSPRGGGGPDSWRQAFNVFDPVSLAEFEAMDGGIVGEMVAVFWGPVQEAIREAKKKPLRDLSIG